MKEKSGFELFSLSLPLSYCLLSLSAGTNLCRSHSSLESFEVSSIQSGWHPFIMGGVYLPVYTGICGWLSSLLQSATPIYYEEGGVNVRVCGIILVLHSPHNWKNVIKALQADRCQKEWVSERERERDKRSVGHEGEWVTSETCFSTRPSVHSKQKGQSLARLQLLHLSLQVLNTARLYVHDAHIHTASDANILQWRARPPVCPTLWPPWRSLKWHHLIKLCRGNGLHVSFSFFFPHLVLSLHHSRSMEYAN